MGARCCEADFQNIVNPAPCVQDGAPAACAMGVNQIADGCNYIRLRQRLHHKRTLPQVIFRKRPML
jgi:hypothetical protein